MVKLSQTIVLLALLASAAAALGAEPLACSIEPDRLAEVGAPVIGVIETLHVERGDRVHQGQVLAILRADVERASLSVAVTRSQGNGDVQAALANFEFLRDKETRSQELLEQNFISRQALDQARAEARVAEQKLAQTREQQRVWQAERQLAQAQLAMRSIKAPFDGVIVDRYVWTGERVESKPLFRIARVNPLRVELMMPVSMYGTVVPGTVLEVTPELPKSRPLRAKVTLVDTVMDSPSNTFRARAALANPDWRLPSGVRCHVALLGAPKGAAAEPGPEARKPRSPVAVPVSMRPPVVKKQRSKR